MSKDIHQRALDWVNDAIARDAIETAQGPHVVVTLCPVSGLVFAQGPYPTGLEATHAAEALRREYGPDEEPPSIYVAPLAEAAP